MALQNLESILGDDSKAKVPDLDWVSLDVGDIDNIPTENNVEILPQLQEAWAHAPTSSTQLLPNVVVETKKAADENNVQDVVDTAKKCLMAGMKNDELITKLSQLFTPAMIKSAKEELAKVASEQGLLGNVYVDMTAFSSCAEANKLLGRNKIRTARFVIGNPKGKCCRNHKVGYCNELKKKVVAEVMYDDTLFGQYTTHMRIAGTLASDETIDSKEALRQAFLRPRNRKAAEETVEKKEAAVDLKKMEKDFEQELQKNAEAIEKEQQVSRFYDVRPILAFMQNEMLKGKIGKSLRESLISTYTMGDIEKYSSEIKKVASLQGLLGNVYVDISYYRNPQEAISAIKKASTNPTYIIQTVVKGEYDDSLARVAKATGCAVLPKDGKIDSKIAVSHVEDLRFSNRISSEKADELRKNIDGGENVLAVIRDAYMAAQEHKKDVREGGVQATYRQDISKKSANIDNIKKASYKALEAGISLDKVESRVASSMPASEAIGLVRGVLASLKEVPAEALQKCATEKYQLSRDASIKKAAKCESCVYCVGSACHRQGAKFAGAKDPEKATIDIDPKTEKVLLADNPDLTRKDMQQEYDMSDSFGSNMTIALENLKKASDVDVDVSFNSAGMDMNIADI